MEKFLKKSAVTMLAVGVLLVPAAPAMPAAAAAVTASQGEQVVAASPGEQQTIRSLTLEQAIARALEVDSNYKILEYVWQQLNLQDEDLEDTKEELEDQLEDIDDKPSERPAPPDNMNNPQEWAQWIEKLLQTMMQPSNDELEDELEYKRDEVEKAIDQLRSQKTLTRLQQQEAREGVRLLVTQQYLGLVSMKQQLLLLEASARQKQQEAQNAFLKYQLGVFSDELLDQAVRQYEDADREAKKLRVQYENALTQFLFLLDLPFHPDFQLVQVTPDERQPVQPPANLEPLVEKSFKVLQAKERLRQARLELKFAEDHDDHENFEETTKEAQARYQVKIAEEQIKQTERTIRTQIYNLYRDAADAQAAYRLAEKKWQDVTKDYERMSLRYEIGLITKQDLDTFDLAVQQAAVQLEAAKNQYFLALAQLKALEAGYVAAPMGGSAAAGPSSQ